MLKSEIKERIYQPTVSAVFDEWEERGLLSETETFVTSLPENYRPPFVHTLIAHVHREKGLFIDIVGEQYSVDDGARKALAFSADALWALSLMVDDIEDGDVTRGNLETSWLKYGEKHTLESARTTLLYLLRYVQTRTRSDQIAEAGVRFVGLGLRSLAEHKGMDLDTPIGILISNYENRCDFHATYQLQAMFRILLCDKYPNDMRSLIKAFRLINQSGQLINDLKDFVAGDMYGRGYSDLRNRVPTVPLVYLYRGLGSRDRAFLKSLYGKSVLTSTDMCIVEEMITRSNVVPNTKSRIADNFSEAIDELAPLLDPKLLKWFEDWTSYKGSLV